MKTRNGLRISYATLLYVFHEAGHLCQTDLLRRVFCCRHEEGLKNVCSPCYER
jgi:hypothetical protein